MSGTLHVVGMGPGDPDLLTLRAARILADAPVIAYFAKRGRPGHARSIADPHLRRGVEEMRFEYPYTTEIAVDDPHYEPGIRALYENAATVVAARLGAGQDVSLLCEGDPFFYGSAMYVFDRLRHAHPTTITPGVTAMSGCWSQARLPMTHGDDVLTVLPGTLDAPALTARLAGGDATVIMKVGRNLPKIRTALHATGLADRAMYVERGTMEGSRTLPLAAVTEDRAPYFSLILVPGRQRLR